MLDWDGLEKECLGCTKCGLCGTRNQVVFGAGSREGIFCSWEKAPVSRRICRASLS